MTMELRQISELDMMSLFLDGLKRLIMSLPHLKRNISAAPDLVFTVTRPAHLIVYENI